MSTISNNYIMPSSLVPVSPCSSPRTEAYFIPPPTAYRDDLPEKKIKSGDHLLLNEATYKAHEENNFELIEIKRPEGSALQQQESDSCLMPELTRQRMRAGLFDLPEVYSPPPLRISDLPPPQQQPQTRPHLDGMMPSFVDHSRNVASYHFQNHDSPRLINSEPTLTSGRQQDVYENFRLQQYVNNIAKAKTLFSLASSIDQNKVREHQHVNPTMVQSFSQDSYFTTTPPPPFVKTPLCHQKLSEPNNQSESPRDILQESLCSSSSKPETQAVLGDKTEGNNNKNISQNNHNISKNGLDECGGSGDKESTMPTIRATNPNCLSPRARPNPLLQPSVITSAMTEPILLECVTNLKSQKWEDNFDAFSQIYNLTEIHPNQVKNLLNKIIWQGLPHLSSSRTKLARMACICFKRLYQTQKRNMEVEGEKVFYRLLDLCGGVANSFLQQESREALVSAVEHMDPLKSISFLELHGSRHKNPHVREFSAYLLNAIMDELPPNRLMNKDFAPRIIPMIVAFLREGLLQTRLHAKLALDKIFDHAAFESKLRRYASPENVRHISDTLREFRERRNGNV